MRSLMVALASLSAVVLSACSVPQPTTSALAAPVPCIPVAVSSKQGAAPPDAQAVEVFCPTNSEQARQAYNDAIMFAQECKLDEAAQSYMRAIELDPGYCDAMDNLGLLLRRQGRVEEAIGLYSYSLSVLPTNTVALTNLGVAYKVLGEPEQAIGAYQLLVEIVPDEPGGYYGLGTVYFYYTQQPQRAILYLEKAEQLYLQLNSPRVVDTQFFLGLSYFELNDCENTEKYLQPIYSEMGDMPEVNYALGICYLTSEPKDIGLARQYITQAQALGYDVPAEVRRALNASR